MARLGVSGIALTAARKPLIASASALRSKRIAERHAAKGSSSRDGIFHAVGPWSKYPAHHREISSIVNAVREAWRSLSVSASSTSATVAMVGQRLS